MPADDRTTPAPADPAAAPAGPASAPAAPKPFRAAPRQGYTAARLAQPYVVLPSGERVEIPPEEAAPNATSEVALTTGDGRRVTIMRTPNGARSQLPPGAATMNGAGVLPVGPDGMPQLTPEFLAQFPAGTRIDLSPEMMARLSAVVPGGVAPLAPQDPARPEAPAGPAAAAAAAAAESPAAASPAPAGAASPADVPAAPPTDGAADAAPQAPADVAAAAPVMPAPPVLEPMATVSAPEPAWSAPVVAEEPVAATPTEPDIEPVTVPIGDEDPAAQTSMARAEAANTEFRSEEIDEILTSMPGGLLRWGSTAVFVTLAVLLGIGWYIRYPDVVGGSVSLTTVSPPVRVVSRAAGEVARVFVADRAQVRDGDPLLLLKTPASYDDVQALSAALDRLEPALQRQGDVPPVAFDRALSLGEVQTPFSVFLQTYSDYRSLLADPYYGQKLAALQAQIGNLGQLGERLKAQQALLDEQLALADRNRARSRQLGTENLSSSAEVDQAEQQYLQQRYASENGRTAITNNEIQLAGQRAALIDLQQRRSDDEQRLLTQLRNAHHLLRAAITAWEQTYVLRAPVSGTVSLFRDVHENQFVSAQEPLVAVLPRSGSIVGRVKLSGVGAGKVRVGQRVIVQLESFPYKEYGTLEGRITRISQLGFEPQQQGQGAAVTYEADVSLPRGLVTSYGRRLGFTQEMRGTVQVVTDDVSLLMRVFNQVRALKELS